MHCSEFSEGKNTCVTMQDLPLSSHCPRPAWSGSLHPGPPGQPTLLPLAGRASNLPFFSLVSLWEQIISANVINDKVVNTGVLQSQSSLWGPGCLSWALEAYSGEQGEISRFGKTFWGGRVDRTW